MHSGSALAERSVRSARLTEHVHREQEPSLFELMLLLGWAGWNHRDQAEALVNLINDLASVDGWEKADSRFVPLLAGLQEVMPRMHQWYDADDPAWGGNPAEKFQTVLTRGRAERYLSESDLRDWRPEKKRGGWRSSGAE